MTPNPSPLTPDSLPLTPHVSLSWLNPFKEQKLVIVGSNGMLVFDDTEPIEKKLVHYPHAINWQNGQPVPQKAEQIAIDLKRPLNFCRNLANRHSCGSRNQVLSRPSRFPLSRE